MESFEKRVESLAPDEPVSDKLNRLAYAGAESVRQEIAERVDRSLKDPLQAAVGFGEQSVAGLMLGSLNKLSTPGKLLVGAIGTGLAASVLKEEASPEKLAQICSTAKSLMDSSSNIDSKIYSMKKTFAPLVLDVGPMIMGFLSGRALNKKKVKSEQPLEWRANGKVVEKKRGITKIYFKHSDGKFYWPFSQDAKEQKLFRQLNKAQQSFGEESFAVGEKRRLLADHFRKNGKLEESGYHYEKAEQATKTAMVRLDAGESGGCVDLGDKAYGQRLKLAEKHLLRAEDQYLKARDMQARNPLEAAKFYDQSALHYKTGIA